MQQGIVKLDGNGTPKKRFAVALEATGVRSLDLAPSITTAVWRSLTVICLFLGRYATVPGRGRLALRVCRPESKCLPWARAIDTASSTVGMAPLGCQLRK